MIKDFSSNFASYMKSMAKEKRNAGFLLEYMDRHLEEFDIFCMSCFPDKASLDKELVEAWAYNTKSKSIQKLQKRFRTMAHLGNYILALGIEAYVPQNRFKRIKPEEPHIFTDAQLEEFFRFCDSVEKIKCSPYRHIVAAVIFRMIYCCGLRNAEACHIKCDDINLQDGIIKIYKSKGHKNRVVYMSEDLTRLCRKYDSIMTKMCPERKYFFLAACGNRCRNTTVSILFNYILEKTSFYGKTSKKPTSHGLRHTFAVNRMRQCLADGENFNILIRYLARYMGHSCIQSTMYYLHLAVNLVPEIRKMAKEYEHIINGVTYVEEN